MKKKKVAERLVPLRDADREWDVRFWQEAGVNARFSAAWTMLREFYKIRGKRGIKLRLQRSVENIYYKK